MGLDKGFKILLDIYIYMKKIISFLSATIALALSSSPAHAALDICPLNKTGEASQFNPLCSLNSNDFGGIVGSAVTLAFIIAVVIALAFLIYGGIRWILSGGDKAGVETARNTIVAAIVGLVVIFLSYFILQFVIGFFIPGFSISNIELPSLNL